MIVELVFLIDTHPPGEFGGGRGFYPDTGCADPPDAERLMGRRC